jgi:hypothetical protein
MVRILRQNVGRARIVPATLTDTWMCPSCRQIVATPYCPTCGERPRNPRSRMARILSTIALRVAAAIVLGYRFALFLITLHTT